MLTLRVVQGAAREAEWHLGPAAMGARRIVGTDPSAEWQVAAPGVAPGHIELYWDGQQLWVCDISKLGTVRVNGQPVGEWVAVGPQSRIEFGGGVIDVLAHQPAAAPPGPGGAVPGFPIQGSAPMPAVGAQAQARVPAAFGGDAGLSAPTAQEQRPSGVDATTEVKPWQRLVRQHKDRLVIGGAAAVVVVFAGFMFFGRSAPPPPVAPPPAPPVSEPPPSMDPGASVAVNADELPPASEIHGLDELPKDGKHGSAATPDGGVEPEKKEDTSGLTPEARAAAALLAGKSVEAYALYAELARANPSKPEFAVVAHVLINRLRRKCVDGVGPGGNPCNVP